VLIPAEDFLLTDKREHMENVASSVWERLCFFILDRAHYGRVKT